jgi:SAM-dependent methyltransferase
MYAVRAPLVRWLRSEARRAHEDLGPYRLLDVGCGVKPYLPVFATYAVAYVGVDPVDNPAADLRGSIEALPVEDASFDVVLCAQVLEHCDDPAAAVGELSRVLRPGGRVLASTHGVMVYHPAPVDNWRWTHTGLERLFGDNGSWSSVVVAPGSGTTACVAMLASIYTGHVLRRARLGALRHPVIAALNGAAEAVDRHSKLLSGTRPGTIAANYHVVAERAA